MVIQIPRAERQDRPVYCGQDPWTGTYRRFNEGDYQCSKDEVRRMFSDQSQQSYDSQILDEFGEADIDSTTLQQYRNRFSARNPQNQWLELNSREFLTKIRGWNTDRRTHKQGPTIAGLLMFGTEDALRDLNGQYVKYLIDYKERVSDNLSDRWLDRLTEDGTWTPNLYQFFFRVYPKLTANLKLPFSYLSDNTLFADPVRTGMPPVHEALQEALVNAIIHADYRGIGGITIDRFPDRFELSNPGMLLISKEQLFRGTVSECRNPCLQLMFQMIGAGDKAGYGFDKICKGWKQQKWLYPDIEETTRPDRFKLKLSMKSLLPDEFLVRLHKQFGENVNLNPDEIDALAIAYSEGKVSNSRIQLNSAMHPVDISKMLQSLVSRGYLVKNGYGRWAEYQIPDLVDKQDENGASLGNNGSSLYSNGASLGNNEPSLGNNESSLGNNESRLYSNKPNSSQIVQINLSEMQISELNRISEEARNNARLSTDRIKEIIVALCQIHSLSIRQIAKFINRKFDSVKKYTCQLVSEGKLVLVYPNQPTHPHQAYRTKE